MRVESDLTASVNHFQFFSPFRRVWDSFESSNFLKEALSKILARKVYATIHYVIYFVSWWFQIINKTHDYDKFVIL